MSQEHLFSTDELNPEIAKVADRVVELMEQKKTVKEQFDIQEKNLMGMLRKLKKAKVRHGGYIIEVNHKDESESLKFKEDKTAKSKKKSGRSKPSENEDNAMGELGEEAA